MNRETPAAKMSIFSPKYPYFKNISGAIKLSLPNSVSKKPLSPFLGLPLIGPAIPKSVI